MKITDEQMQQLEACMKRIRGIALAKLYQTHRNCFTQIYDAVTGAEELLYSIGNPEAGDEGDTR